MLPKVTYIAPYLGCDPEFFFKLNGETIGAEKIIPKDGLTVNSNVSNALYGKTCKFTIDGVQAELNPRPNDCRANLANELKICFKTLQDELLKHKDIKVDFSRTVEISKDKLMELNEESRKFGCAPSESIYNKKSNLKIDGVDPTEYRTRAAGGHIHIGKGEMYLGLQTALTTKHKQTVAMLDLLCGNTCVLVDREESNIERRKLYGKAGEFRLPAHGLEYRTLSNFWLTSYPLMSLAFGMARYAVQLMADDKNSELYFNEFTSKVKPKDIKAAINNNDYDLAMANFKAIEGVMIEAMPIGRFSNYPINSENIKEFYHFTSVVKERGLGYWFNDDPMTHWVNLQEAHTGGFSDFLVGPVKKDMIESKLKVSLAQ